MQTLVSLTDHIQSSKIVHTALLLLMLEAAYAGPRFTISLKRSTLNLQLSTSWQADYPIYWSPATQSGLSGRGRLLATLQLPSR